MQLCWSHSALQFQKTQSYGFLHAGSMFGKRDTHLRKRWAWKRWNRPNKNTSMRQKAVLFPKTQILDHIRPALLSCSLWFSNRSKQPELDRIIWPELEWSSPEEINLRSQSTHSRHTKLLLVYDFSHLHALVSAPILLSLHSRLTGGLLTWNHFSHSLNDYNFWKLYCSLSE